MFWYLFRRLILSQRSSSIIRKLSVMSFTNVGMSLFAFFLILSVMSGMNETIETRILMLTPHLTATFSSAGSPAEESSPDDQMISEFIQESKLQLEHAAAFEKQDLIVRTMDGQFRGVQGYGLDAETFSFIFDHIEMLEAKNRPSEVKYSLGYQVPAEDEVLLGTDLARGLGVLDGEEITLITPESFVSGGDQSFKARRVVVRHILTTQVEDLDSQFVFYQKGITLSSFQMAASLRKGHEFWFKNLNSVDQFKKYLETRLEKTRLETWKDRNSALFLALLLEKMMIGLFLGMAGILSGFSVVTVMILLISQKRRDIAVLKALGLSDRSIVHLFARVGTLLGLVGIVPGLLLSLLLSLYIEFFPIQILPDIYYDSTIPAHVDLYFFLIVFVSSVGLCFLASYFPARKTLGVGPSDILKGS